MTIKYNKTFIPQRADPYIVRSEDGTYYFTASIPSYDGIILRHADTIAELADAQEIEIWHKHEKGIMSIHVWAPEMHYLQGSWYMYYSAGDIDDIWAIRPYVLKCTGSNPLTDKWIECGPMQAANEDEFSFTAFSLDATIFENNGKHFYIWAEKVGTGKQISNLYIAEMETPIKLGTVQELLTTPDYKWERVGFWVNEGPAVIKHDGKIYVTYSASDTGPAYCLGLLAADENSDVLDRRNWIKFPEPILKTDYKKGIYGPGHNSFTVDENGEPLMVFHARTEEKINGNPLYNPNRHTMIMPVKWNIDGSPCLSFE